MIRACKRSEKKRHIAAAAGLSYSATCKTIDRYETEGAAALVPRKRGRRESDRRALDAVQEVRIRQLICDQYPEQLKIELALSSRIAVHELILRE